MYSTQRGCHGRIAADIDLIWQSLNIGTRSRGNIAEIGPTFPRSVSWHADSAPSPASRRVKATVAESVADLGGAWRLDKVIEPIHMPVFMRQDCKHAVCRAGCK